MVEVQKDWWKVRKHGKWRAFRNLPVFWAHQRTSYMDRSELIFHSVLYLLAFGLIYLLLALLVAEARVSLRLVFALLAARTLSFVFNDTFWTCLTINGLATNGGLPRTCGFLERCEKRVAGRKSVSACAVYGSMSRGQFHSHSDVDVRYIRRSGFANALSATAFASQERLLALIHRIPLDSFVGDSVGFLDKMRDDEIPIVLKDADGLLERRYGRPILLSSVSRIAR